VSAPEPTSGKYDAIVVGSGISGGWAAKELTEKGLKTLLLEAGPDYGPADSGRWPRDLLDAASAAM